MINTKEVTFSYEKDKIFHMPDLLCFPGETILITGNSGTGKTTYLHLLAGLIQPSKGSISIDNEDISLLSNTKLDAFRGKNIGIVFQKSYFINALSVLENLEMASWLVLKNKNTSKCIELLKKLEIYDKRNNNCSELSVGQLQRLSIARALVNEPKLLLADEPTSSLDDTNANNVLELLTNLAKEYKAALVIVTHDNRIKSKFSNQITMV